MKELSIEEKAKAYDEALKKAKSKIKNDKDHVFYEDDFIEIFPELAESEEEKIRKWCISHFKECINVIKDNDEYKEYLSNKVLAWLEKQGEKKPAACNEEDEKVINLACSILYSNFNENENFDKNQMCIREIIDKLKSLRPQSHWKPSKKQMAAVRIAAEIGTANNYWAMGILKGMYQDLKKLREE